MQMLKQPWTGYTLAYTSSAVLYLLFESLKEIGVVFTLFLYILY